LSEYFGYFGLSLSIKIIRQMAETEMFDAWQAGSVTEQQYMNSCVAAGHSERTAKKYYRISKETVSRTQTGFAALMGDDVDSVMSPTSYATPTASICEPVLLSTPSTPTVLPSELAKRTLDCSPAPAGKRALADKVVVQMEREKVIAEVARDNMDGSLHPFFTSDKKKIPATNWERSWLMKYFMKMPSELSGNYYRYDLYTYIHFNMFVYSYTMGGI
jgi:hypothetical protein